MRLTAAVATLSTAVIAGAAAVPAVTDVRIGDYPSKTRFVLDISERVDYRVFSLVDPYRVVIDLPEVAWRLEGVGTPRGLVAKFRYGLFRRGQSRMVIDADTFTPNLVTT